jgi:hypothetical protein
MRCVTILIASTALLKLSSVPAFAQQAPASITATSASGSATVEIIDLKRTDEGNTLTIRGVFKNNADTPADLDVNYLSLIDFKNKKRYLVIKDAEYPHQCICSTPDGSTKVQQGSSVRFWAKLPAPPESVTAMSLAWSSLEPVSIPIRQ